MSIKLFIKQIFAQYLMVNVHKLPVIHNVVSSNTVFKKTEQLNNNERLETMDNNFKFKQQKVNVSYSIQSVIMFANGI